MTVRILVGDCREVMAEMPAESVDSIVTDPPYDLTAASRNGSPRVNDPTKPYGRHNLQPKGGFMGKQWDATGVAFDPEAWRAVHRVLAPGGHLLAFGGTRTFHRMTCAIEDAGFEIKDCLSWLYGSGFPKHKSLLKPAWEPIVLAKKRGAGVLDIDGCRLGDTVETWPASRGYSRHDPGSPVKETQSTGEPPAGRWPPNVCLDEAAAAALDAMSGERTSGHLQPHHRRSGPRLGVNTYGTESFTEMATGGASYGGDTGGASRFMYVAKADRAERNAGLEGLPKQMIRWSSGDQNPGSFQSDGTDKTARNHHPTVKPVALMRWLVRLVTPPGGVCLDPFMGSGSTGIACVYEERDFIGIEREADYAEIARRRIEHAQGPMFASVALEAIG